MSGENYVFASFSQRDKSYALVTYLWHFAAPVMTPAVVLGTSKATDVKKENRGRPSYSSPALSEYGDPTFVKEGKCPSSKRGSCEESSLGTSSMSMCTNDPTVFPDGGIDDVNDLLCPCLSHTGRLLVDDIFSLNCSQLFSILFSDVPWYRQYPNEVRQTAHGQLFDSISGYSASPWVSDRNGDRSRTVSYTMALNYAMAPKSTVVTEKQVYSEFSGNVEGFIVSKQSQNSGIPYADSFYILCTYCIIKLDDSRCRLRIHGGLVFRKSLWGIVKGCIEKSTYTGLEEHYSALEETLKLQCDQDRASAGVDESEIDVTGSPPDPEDLSLSRVRGNICSSLAASIASSSRIEGTRSNRSVEVQTEKPLLPWRADIDSCIKLIIALLTALVLLHIFSVFQAAVTHSGSCPNVDRLLEFLSKSSDNGQVSLDELLKLYQLEKRESAMNGLFEAVSQIAHQVDEVRDIWRKKDEG
ncbi:hypothetical protein AB6A40_002332 [Gnathostoma spinigerum]|uniref:VASt domain-containing protein n=1 Tax=Gnathostoma spinigerum TaxID=75299 RepID=A0ABD6E6A3_9BILA